MPPKSKLGGVGGEPVVPGQEEAKQAKSDEQKRREQENLEAQTPLIYSKEKPRLNQGPEYLKHEISLHKKDEINPYAEAQRKRYGLDYRTRRIVILAVIVLLVMYVVFCIATSAQLGSDIFDFSLAEVIEYWNQANQGLISALTGHDSMYATYVWATVAALFAGVALGLTGGVYQGALRNGLASPSTLGVMNGGSLGIVIYVVLFYDSTSAALAASGVKSSELYDIYAQGGFWNLVFNYYGFGMFFAALIGCGVVVAVILLIATVAGRGRVTNISLVIAGQVFAAAFTIIIDWIKEYMKSTGDPGVSELITETQSASFNGVYTHLTILAFIIPLIICIVIIFAMSNRLSLLAFSDEEARSMGISTGFTRNLLVAICTVMTALVIAYVGVIGFVGFMAPHIARNLVGPNFRYLLPACMCIGALLVVVSYLIANLGISWLGQSSTGTITSVIGALMFVFVAFSQRKSSNGTWL